MVLRPGSALGSTLGSRHPALMCSWDSGQSPLEGSWAGAMMPSRGRAMMDTAGQRAQPPFQMTAVNISKFARSEQRHRGVKKACPGLKHAQEAYLSVTKLFSDPAQVCTWCGGGDQNPLSLARKFVVHDDISLDVCLASVCFKWSAYTICPVIHLVCLIHSRLILLGRIWVLRWVRR